MAETVTELRDEILAQCQDSSFTSTRILRYLNDCVKHVSSVVQLPALEDSDTVTTDTSLAYKAMPADYQRHLYKCHSDTHNRWVKIYESLPMLDMRFTDLTTAGDVVGVTVQGSNLHYRRIPSSAETLRLYFLKKPTTLTTASTVSDIPESFVRGLMVNFTLREIFKVKGARDGAFLENANLYGKIFGDELNRLQMFLGAERKPPVDVPDELGLDSLY